MYCSLGFRLDSSDIFGAGDHAPVGQINSPSARSLVKMCGGTDRVRTQFGAQIAFGSIQSP